MKQATLVEIAESCKVTRSTVWSWAKKASKKISSIKNKLANAKPHHPAVFNEDEIVCIVGAHLEIMGDFTEAALQDPIKKTPQDPMEKLHRIRCTFDGIPASTFDGIPANKTNDSLQIQQRDSLQNETNNLLQKKQSLTIDQKIKIAELVVEVAKLSEQTRPGMQLDYHLNIAKKRLSGLAANNKYTPALNLLEAPNNEEE